MIQRRKEISFLVSLLLAQDTFDSVLIVCGEYLPIIIILDTSKTASNTV